MDVLIFLIQWYSFIAWKFMNNNAKAKFRDVEKIEKKLVTLKLHLQFNEIYIYVYMYRYNLIGRVIIEKSYLAPPNKSFTLRHCSWMHFLKIYSSIYPINWDVICSEIILFG